MSEINQKEINQREIIVNTLMDILEDGKYNNLALQESLKENESLTKIQKAFITKIVNGTLRNLIKIDYIINFYSNTKTNKMKPFILNLLRASVYQIKFMDKVPVSAVCNEAVNLTKEKSFKNLSGFVNGVLRNIVRNNPEINYPTREEDIFKFLSIEYSIDNWILKYWNETLTLEEIENICKIQNTPPLVTICINTLKTNRADLIKILKEEDIEVFENNILENALYIKGTSDISKKQSFIKGLYHIMDESSMMAVEIMGPEKNKIIYDMCSAPGGKAFYISYLTENTGEINAFDIFDHKIMLIKNTAKRLGIKNIKAEINNAEIFDKEKLQQADFVLVDAPCSGLGMLQKKPDIKYNKSRKDIENLSKLQKDILNISAQYVKEKGILVYSTCTISKKENEDNIKWFLEKFDFELEDAREFLPPINATEKYVQILPTEFGADGFFIGRFRRKEKK